MSYIKILIGVSLSTLIISTSMAEQARWAGGASLRSRYEAKQNFNFSSSQQDYLLTRVRANLSYKPNEKMQVFVEFQDARVHGEERAGVPGLNTRSRPSVYEDHLDLHQTWLKVSVGEAELRVGRQKFSFSDQRLVSPLEWVNTARVHDGVRLRFGDSNRRVANLFVSRVVAVDPHGFNDYGGNHRYFDSTFHGVHVNDRTTKLKSLEYWFYYRHNGDVNDTTATIGGRLTLPVRSLIVELQGAYQFGEFASQQHRASMLRTSVEGQIGRNSVAAGWTYGSGDGDPNDGRHETFDNLYPLNHAYYGYMDLFGLQNLHNVELVWRRPFRFGLSARVALQSFWLADEKGDAWYNAGLGIVRQDSSASSAHVGNEVDLSLSTKLADGQWQIAAGLSRFFAGSYVESTGSSGRDPQFFFFQVTYVPRS